MHSPNMTRSQRAQIQMAESIGAIIIVTLLIVFGIIFYSKIQAGGIRQEQTTARALSGVELAQRLAALPELACSSSSVQDAACIDLHKAEAFAAIANSSDAALYYYQLFGNARIELDKIYTPPSETNIPFDSQLVLYENNASLHQSQSPVFIPFAVQNGLTGESYLGYIAVYAYTASSTIT